jgi:hypothetical protein
VSRTTQVARQFVQYHQRVLETGPIGYWLLDEKQGTVAYDWVAENGVQNGAHTGVTLYQDGIGDGRTSPFYDGANDYTNIYSIPLNGAFDPNLGSLAVWCRVNAAGVWTDGAFRFAAIVYADGNNYLDVLKANVNNTLWWRYRATGITEQITRVGVTTTDWFHMCITWDKAGNAMTAYYNGVIEGVPQAIAGNWVGALHTDFVNIGCQGNNPLIFPWHGWLGHGAIWDRALSGDEILNLYNAGVSH